MAHIHPDGWREKHATGPAARRIDTLEALAAGLSDDYRIFHGVHWSHVEAGHARFGGIDFAIVDAAGDVLLIEQVTGLLAESASGLHRRTGAAAPAVTTRLAHSRDAMAVRLAALAVRPPVRVDALLHCPDHSLRDPGSAGLDPARIVDAGRRDQLAAVVRNLLPDVRADATRQAAVCRFMADMLRLVPDTGALIGAREVLYTRLAGGLAHWGRRIDMAPFRLRVIGTAGSGKTQLALAVLRDAVAAGRKPLYVCYNRPLADHIARIAPEGATVTSYHQLCDRLYRGAGGVPDFAQADAFSRIEAFMTDCPAPAGDCYDELIVDEGQDFKSAWLAPLLALLRPDGRAWWLEDPMQNLYAREQHPLPGWVTLRAERNHRSPREVIALIDRILERNGTAGDAVAGAGVEVLVYDDPAALMERTKTALTRALGAGFRKESMLVVTFRGREQSAFTPLSRLGPHALRAFTGRYDLLGGPVYTEGNLLIDSVYRLKGQSAPCVVFTEIDFETLDERARRKLFVGMTRASMKLILVISSRAHSALGAHLASQQAGDG